MTAYTTAAVAQSPFERELGALLAKGSQVDPVALCRPVLADVAGRIEHALDRVRIGKLKRGRVEFAAEKLPASKQRQKMKRRFFALMLIVLGELRGQRKRAWTRQLWRGKRERWEVDTDGEVKRVYVRARRKDGSSGAQAGLAGRLSCSVREVDRYLQVASAAGLISVWQGPTRDKAERSKGHFEGGRTYAYAVFQWLAELPRRIADRIQGRQSALDRAERSSTLLRDARPPDVAQDVATYGDEAGSIAAALRELRERLEPPS